MILVVSSILLLGAILYGAWKEFIEGTGWFHFDN